MLTSCSGLTWPGTFSADTTDLLTQEEALGGEHGEAVHRRALSGAVRRRRLAHLHLLLLGEVKRSAVSPTINAGC